VATKPRAGHLKRVARRRCAAVQAHTADWSGASGDAYRSHAGQQLDAIGGIATASPAISYAVEGAGLLVGLVRGIVRDLIAQFIATLAARLPQWLAEEGLTLGLATPVVVGQVAALVAKWVNKIQHFVRALLTSLRRPVWQYQAVPALSGLLSALPGVPRDQAAPSCTTSLRRCSGKVSHLPQCHAPRGAGTP
jgi:hypothetical protein